MSWHERAECRKHDPELFYSVGTSKLVQDRIAAAKAICASCPVTAQCLAYALETDEQHGIWGGTTEEERQDIKRRVLRNR